MAKGYDAEKKRLVAFLAEHLYAKQEDEAPLRNFRVSHHQEGTSKSNLVTNAHVRGERAEPDALADNILLACQGDADASGGVHRYVVRAMYGIRSEEARGGRHIIKLRGDTEKDDDDTLDGIEVGPRGVLSMLMRHQEGTQKYAFLHGSEIMDKQFTLIDRLIQRNEALETRQVSMFDTIQRMSDDRLNREIEARKQLRREKREDLAISLAMRYLPGMLAEKTGGPNAALIELVSGLSDEQIEQIHKTLAPDQQKKFLPVVLKVLKERAEAEAKEKIARAKQDAEEQKILDQAEGKSLPQLSIKDADFTLDPMAKGGASVEKTVALQETGDTPFATFLDRLSDDELAGVKAVLSEEEIKTMMAIARGEGEITLGAFAQGLGKEKIGALASAVGEGKLGDLQALIVKSLTEGK